MFMTSLKIINIGIKQFMLIVCIYYIVKEENLQFYFHWNFVVDLWRTLHSRGHTNTSITQIVYLYI